MRRLPPTPEPRTTVLVRGPVPGAAVRLALVALVAGAGALLAPELWGAALFAVLAATLGWRPQAPLAAAVVGLLALLVLLRPGVDAQLHLTVLVVPAVLRLAALAEHLPWRATVEVGVLGRVARSLLVVQLPAQLLTVLAGRLSGEGPVPWLAVVAVLAVGVLGWVLLRPPAGPR